MSRDLDDDFPPSELSRNDIIKVREFLAQIEENGGEIPRLNREQVQHIHRVLALFSKHGVPEALEALGQQHLASVYWQTAKARLWRSVKWLSIGLSSIFGLILGADQVWNIIKGWLR